jgi:PAS domain S-box-containing protein
LNSANFGVIDVGMVRSSKVNPRSLQDLAFSHAEMAERLKVEERRVKLLLGEVDRLSSELDCVRSSQRLETDNRLVVEEVLWRTRDHLEIAVEAADLVLWDMKQPFQQIALQHQWCELIGEPRSDTHWDVKVLKERTHPDDVAKVVECMRGVLVGGKERDTLEFRFRRGHRWLWLQAHGAAVEHDSEGRVTALIGTVSDVTQRKEREMSLAAAKELALLQNQAKSSFLSTFSHEVRTPLNGIIGLNALLKSSKLDTEQQHWVALMEQSGQALLRLMNDTLDLSKIEAGKMLVESEPFELMPFLNSTCNVFVAQATVKGIRFDKAFDWGLPNVVLGDAGRMRQLLSNLLANAIKFTDPGGHVSLSVEVRAGNSLPLLVFTVRDSGIGIGEQEMSKLFQPFQQATNIARQYGGSGLGLAICAKLVDLMGGKMHVKSRVGEGSSFIVQVPLYLPSGAAPSDLFGYAAQTAQVAKDIPKPEFHVLVAVTLPSSHGAFGAVLSALGCSVSIAGNESEVLDLTRRHCVDAILMEPQTHNCSCLSLVSTIRAEEAAGNLSRLPIIAMVLEGVAAEAEAALMAAGMDGWVCTPAELHTRIETLMRIGPHSRGSAVPTRVNAHQDREEVTLPAFEAVADKSEWLGLDREVLPLASSSHGQVFQIEQHLRGLLDGLGRDQGAEDLARVRSVLHKLDLMEGHVNAKRAKMLCSGLTLAASSGNRALFARALPLLRSELEQVLASVARKAMP